MEYEIEGVPTVVALNLDEELTVFDSIFVNNIGITGYNTDHFKNFMTKVHSNLLAPKK